MEIGMFEDILLIFSGCVALAGMYGLIWFYIAVYRIKPIVFWLSLIPVLGIFILIHFTAHNLRALYKPVLLFLCCTGYIVVMDEFFSDVLNS